MTIIYAIILFVLMIFPHELGHFIVAKSVGIKVNEFAFGMGPALFKKQGKETKYVIRAVPFGGYCAMEGENDDSDNSRSFNNKPGWAKIAVLLAGSFMNVLIAILALSIIAGVNGSPTTTISEVVENGPAYVAGVKAGDEIIAVDGNKIKDWNDLNEAIGKESEALEIEVLRNGRNITIESKTEKSDDNTGRYIIGVMPKLDHNPFTAVKNGSVATWNMTKSMYSSLKQLVTGHVDKDQISGPVGLINLVSDTNKYGLIYFGYLLALISLNLAIINMLPFPALDGGRILFVIIRKITGKMITDEMEGKIHACGMALLLSVMLLVTWNDITRLFK